MKLWSANEELTVAVFAFATFAALAFFAAFGAAATVDTAASCVVISFANRERGSKD